MGGGLITEDLLVMVHYIIMQISATQGGHVPTNKFTKEG